MTEDENQIEEANIQEVRITVDGKQDPLRIDKFLVNRLDKVSRNRIQNAISVGSLTVNGKIVKSNYKIRPLDDIFLLLPRSSHSRKLEAEDIALNIVYEDDDVLVLNKEAGMVVHPGVGNYTGTMAHALAFHFQKQNITGLDSERPGIVHRIDKQTSGLLVVAKNELALSHLGKQFYDKSANRKYAAIIWGCPEEDEGTVDAYIGRSQSNRKIFTTFPDSDEGKAAVTHYKLIENLGYVSVVECVLETGRTHQIRVHMKSINHPIFGDTVYGGDKIVKGTVYSKYKQFVHNCFTILPRQALHAKLLGFVHPVSREYMEFESPLPADMEAVLTKWRTYTKDLIRKA